MNASRLPGDPTPPDERIQAITHDVREEILQHMADFQKYAPDYIRAYVEAITGPQTTKRPRTHLHPKLAEFIREVALESRAAERCAVRFQQERQAA